ASRAMLLASAYVAGIAVTFGVLGTICGLTGSKFGAYLGSPWVVWPLALFFAAKGLSMFGAFEVALPRGAALVEVRGVRGRAAAGAAVAAVARRRARLRRRVPDGPRGRHHRR